MATKHTDTTSAQGAEGAATEQVEGQQLVAETPEWVEQLLKSNKDTQESNKAAILSNSALAESNQAVIDAVASFKEAADALLEASKKVEQPAEKPSAPDFDEDADYKVAKGKSFRDSKDFTKEYTEGKKVTHLGAEVLTRLLAQGLVEEVQ